MTLSQKAAVFCRTACSSPNSRGFTTYSSLQGDHLDVDKRWVRLLSRQVQTAEVELVANLGHAQLTLEDILTMKVGDVVPITVPPRLHAEVDGVPVLECQYGVFNGQYALKVQKVASTLTHDAPQGEEHA